MGDDLISGLPDEVLHAILVRLRSARAAARTSVLSRRWRHVWPHMTEILLDRGTEALPPASFLDAVDGALAGCLAPTLERLTISLPTGRDLTDPPGRAAPWLRFAAERVAGQLSLSVHPGEPLPLPVELEVPACGRAKEITLFLRMGWRLRLQPAGLFTALTALAIYFTHMEGSELSTLVCTRCPRLTNLWIKVVLVAVADVSICSDSLRSLCFSAMNTRRLEVVAPRLEALNLRGSVEVHVSAPKLAKLFWHGRAYDPHSHRFHDVGRRLSLLEIGFGCAAAALMQRFDEVDVLKLGIHLTQVRWNQQISSDNSIF
jgi:hypothetical protein